MKKNLNADYFRTVLEVTKKAILKTIKRKLKKLGGRICLRHYAEWVQDYERNVYFECDDDGYGRELFLDTVFLNPKGELEVYLHDSEDCYNPFWEAAWINPTDMLYMLTEIEQVEKYIQETGSAVVTDYDPDYDPENN